MERDIRFDQDGSFEDFAKVMENAMKQYPASAEKVLKKEDATRKSVMAFNMTMFITNRLEPRRCGRLESLSWLVRGRVEWFRPLV